MPFSEEFDAGYSLREWTINNPDSDKTWDTINLPPVAGGSVAWINFYGYFKVNKRDQLISAPLNFSNYTSLHLTFDHAYAQRSTIKDSLIVKISTDCGASWTRILAAGPDDNDPNVFATHVKTGGFFSPQSAEDWCGSGYGTACYDLDISAFAGQPNARIMFESFNRNGNNLYLDNIMIDGPVNLPVPGSDNSEIRIFPNPSDGFFTLDFGIAMRNTDISVFDMNGQRLYHEVLPPGNGPFTKKLNLSGLFDGVYYIRFITEDTTQVKKIIINQARQ